jgi:glycosyltransferase involved in cell wall biosynthesis
MPKVSVCVPNLNNIRFLPQRFEAIFAQTLQDWELVVCDGHSDDGAWEYIQGLARMEPRMHVSQTPRRGIYAGLNDCIAAAQGDYIYLATSDDTMAPDCLEKMVQALESHPDCGICQCQLVLIDEDGKPLPADRQWLGYTLGSYEPALVQKVNKRMAPHDGLLFPALFTIYTSLTQLLIRKEALLRVGPFDGRWGSISDFEWGMRVGLLENCIYIPQPLATWRQHTAQSTRDVHTPENRGRMLEMTASALSYARSRQAVGLEHVALGPLLYFLHRDILEMGWRTERSSMHKLCFLARQLPQRPIAVLGHVFDRFGHRSWAFWRCPNRYAHLRRMLARFHAPRPVFET